MDLRVVKTEKNIINAFIELRAKKDLEKITVKELCQLAFINKSTFYLHYRDIYDLADKLEEEAISSLLKGLEYIKKLKNKPKEAFEDLVNAMVSQGELFNILFSGSRKSHMVDILEKEIKEQFYKEYSEYRDCLEVDLFLTVIIHGVFKAASDNVGKDFYRAVEILSDVNESLIKSFFDNNYN